LRDGELVAPRTEVETELAAILSALLAVEGVSVENNFFLLGGHSLLDTKLIVRVRDVFGVELSLHTLFDAPTIADLAAHIERARARAKRGRVRETRAERRRRSMGS